MTLGLMHVYNRLPVSMEKGQGAWLWDSHGNKYIDALSGIGVSALGHNHPNITRAIVEQAEKVIHTSNIFTIAEQEALAQELLPLAQMEKVFFSNSGAEANEAAIKLARLYGHQQGIDVPGILVFEKAFHGRTLATLSASASRKIQAGYEPLVSGFVRAPYNDVAAIQQIAEHSKNIVAVMLEPVLGNAGIVVPDAGYLTAIREICDANNWLLILDEIQTGVARTGKFYAYQHEDLVPDILTSAKALGNGIPIGACMARGVASELFTPGKHGSTFGGNPFASHVARTVVKTIIDDNICENVTTMGAYLTENLRQALTDQNGVVAIRQHGLMLAIELDKPCREIYQIGLDNGILFSVAAEKNIRMLPPLIINKEEADIIAERMSKTIKDFYA